MRKFDTGELIVPGIVALFVISYHVQVRDIPRDVLIWPLIVTVILLLLLAAVLFQMFRGFYGAVTNKPLLKPMALLLSSVVYLMVMPYLGYTLATFGFLMGLQIYLGARPANATIVAFSTTAILHVVMIIVMGLSLPRLETPFLTL